MKAILKVLVLPAMLVALVSMASADSITLASAAGSSSNHANGHLEYLGYSALNTCTTIPCYSTLAAPANSTHASASPHTSYVVSPGSSWTVAMSGTSWVSNTATAGPGCSGSQCQANDFYYYETTFNAAGGVGRYSGSISIMADDTAEVILDAGTADELVLAPFAIIGTDSSCATGRTDGSDKLPNCKTVETISFSGISLLNGTNTLTIIDAQTKLSGEGIDFKAQFNDAPEPSSLLLLGTGLLGLAFLVFRRKSMSAMAEGFR